MIDVLVTTYMGIILFLDRLHRFKVAGTQFRWRWGVVRGGPMILSRRTSEEGLGRLSGSEKSSSGSYYPSHLIRYRKVPGSACALCSPGLFIRSTSCFCICRGGGCGSNTSRNFVLLNLLVPSGGYCQEFRLIKTVYITTTVIVSR
jgi:hypothetical protein